MVADTGGALIECAAAATDDQGRTAGVAAADEDVIDAAERPVEVHLVRVFRDESVKWLARVGGLPGTAVTDAHVLDNVTAGPEPHAV